MLDKVAYNDKEKGYYRELLHLSNYLNTIDHSFKYILTFDSYAPYQIILSKIYQKIKDKLNPKAKEYSLKLGSYYLTYKPIFSRNYYQLQAIEDIKKRLKNKDQKIPTQYIIRKYDFHDSWSLQALLYLKKVVFMVMPKQGSLKTNFYNIISDFKDFLNYVGVDHNKAIEERLSYIETYVRVDFSKTEQLYDNLKSFILTLSKNFNKEIKFQQLGSSQGDYFVSLFRFQFNLVKIRFDLKVYFPENYRETINDKDSIFRHPKVESKIYLKDKELFDDAIRDLLINLNRGFLVSFLIFSKIRSDDFIPFSDNYTFHNYFVSKEQKEKYDYLVSYF